MSRPCGSSAVGPRCLPREARSSTAAKHTRNVSLQRLGRRRWRVKTRAKLDRYDLLILDDLSYVRKDQAETSVLFELIAERYERRSILITANQPFSGWDNVFPDPGMTVAAIDRLVHHSTIFELNQVESYRGKEAARQQKLQRDNAKAQAKHARQTAGTE